MSYFSNVNMSEVKTGTTQKQPVWDPHAPMASLENDEFSFRTVSSDFKVGGVPYRISCFQMKAGYFERNNNVEGIVKFADMIDHVQRGLVENNLEESFGLDCSTFKQDKGKNAARNLCIYIMPRLSSGVRSYLDAVASDMVKKEADEAETSESSPRWTSRKRQNHWGNK